MNDLKAAGWGSAISSFGIRHYFDQGQLLAESRCAATFQVQHTGRTGIGRICGRHDCGGRMRSCSTWKRPRRRSLAHISHLLPYHSRKIHAVGPQYPPKSGTRRDTSGKEKKRLLLWVLDRTRTAMGARKLRSTLEQPFIQKEEILKRFDAIDELNANMITREELREYLNPIYDLERLLSKISYKSANPRDFIALKSSLRCCHRSAFCVPILKAGYLRKF